MELPKVLVGKKPSGSYVLYGLTTLANAPGIIVEARGNNIPKAIRVAFYIQSKVQQLKLQPTVGVDTIKTQTGNAISPWIQIALTK